MPGQTFIDRKRKARMNLVDNFSAPIRALIHDYGLCVVKAFLDCGVTKPKQIRHLVETVLNEFSPTRGSNSAQGPRVPSTTQDEEPEP